MKVLRFILLSEDRIDDVLDSESVIIAEVASFEGIDAEEQVSMKIVQITYSKLSRRILLLI